MLSLRWSAQLIVNPEALPWLQARLFQDEALSDRAATFTLEEITAEVTAQNRVVGTPLTLAENGAAAASEFWLLPIQAPPAAPPKPAEILELRLYRRVPDLATVKLKAVTTLPVARLPDSLILAPLLGTPQKILPTHQTLPLSQVERLPPSPTQGVWLTLQGQWQRSGTTLRYGQLLYFDVQNRTLEALIPWSSPTPSLPRWVDLDGHGPVDLLIDETVGLEPAFQGYRLQPKQGLGPAMQLVPVTLTGVPTDLVDREGAYYRTLSLARSGLWSEAQRQIQVLKPKLGQQWTPAAEAQLQLITLHAEHTRQQADRNWSIPSQQILVSLIDGRWEAALKQLEASPANRDALMRILAQDEGRFWNRVTAALRVQPQNPAVQVWGGLILKAQQDQQAALAWLNQQQVQASTRSRFWALANPPIAVAKVPQQSATRGAIPVSASPPVKPLLLEALLGSAAPVADVDLAQWQPLQSAQALQLADQETWYQVQVLGWQRAGAWGSADSGVFSPQTLKAGLAPVLAEPLQLTSSSQAPIDLRVMGLQVAGGRLLLLAAGKAAAAGLATSAPDVLWLASLQVRPVDSPTLALKALQTALETSGSTVGQPDLAPLLAPARQYSLDVTGDGREDWLVTLPDSTLARLSEMGVGCDRTAPKTLIFNAQGQLLYSDLFSPQALVALTQPNFVQPIALVAEQNSQYGLHLWSAERRQFE